VFVDVFVVFVLVVDVFIVFVVVFCCCCLLLSSLLLCLLTSLLFAFVVVLLLFSFRIGGHKVLFTFRHFCLLVCRCVQLRRSLLLSCFVNTNYKTKQPLQRES